MAVVSCSNVQVGLRLSTWFMHCTPLWYCRVCVSFNNGTILFILHCYDTMLHNTQCLMLLHTAISIECFWSTPFRAPHTGYILDINIRKVDTACNCCISTTTSSLTCTTRGIWHCFSLHDLMWIDFEESHFNSVLEGCCWQLMISSLVKYVVCVLHS